jgi:hypothetical protein
MSKYDFKFRVVKNIGTKSEECLGKVGTIHEVKNGCFCDELGIILKGYKTINDVKEQFDVKAQLSNYKFKTEIELVEDDQELTPVEFLRICHKICDSGLGCSVCEFKKCCFEHESNDDYAQTYEVAKQWKKDHLEKQEEKKFAAVWKYDILSDGKLVGTANSEEEAVKRCEQYAIENPFDCKVTYSKYCTYGVI